MKAHSILFLSPLVLIGCANVDFSQAGYDDLYAPAVEAKATADNAAISDDYWDGPAFKTEPQVYIPSEMNNQSLLQSACGPQGSSGFGIGGYAPVNGQQGMNYYNSQCCWGDGWNSNYNPFDPFGYNPECDPYSHNYNPFYQTVQCWNSSSTCQGINNCCYNGLGNNYCWGGNYINAVGYGAGMNWNSGFGQTGWGLGNQNDVYFPPACFYGTFTPISTNSGTGSNYNSSGQLLGRDAKIPFWTPDVTAGQGFSPQRPRSSATLHSSDDASGAFPDFAEPRKPAKPFISPTPSKDDRPSFFENWTNDSPIAEPTYSRSSSKGLDSWGSSKEKPSFERSNNLPASRELSAPSRSTGSSGTSRPPRQ